jgi:2-polyprenyl-6-hydroxyphenyl methylase/3-demethylubiquinone-9 3-methyltransferase
MEVLEHVDSVDLLIKKSRESLNNGGFFVGSTINQTVTSYLTAIFLAENILRIVPKSTHEWTKFIRPNKLKKLLIMNEFSNIRFQGVFYNFLKKKWNYVNTEKINYLFSSKLE